MATRDISVTLPNNTVYVTGNVNGTATTFTLTGTVSSGTIWTADVDRVIPDVYVCELTAVNSAGSSSTVNVTLYYGLQLITNRTQADVDRLLELSGKRISGMTDSELSEWLEGMKGAYNATDLNRVESAVRYIAERLETVTGIFLLIDVYTLWDRSMCPIDSDMKRYLSNISILRNQFPMPQEVPQVPSDMDRLTYQEANDIEKILLAIDDAITRVSASWFYAGELYAGEVQ